MPIRPRFKLIAAAGLIIALAGAALGNGAEYLGSYRWPARGDPLHGGISGMILSEDGKEFVAVSDRAAVASGRLLRENGLIKSIQADRFRPLIHPSGAPLQEIDVDAEGLTRLPNGEILVSFEGKGRIGQLDPETGMVKTLPIPEVFTTLQLNSGLEALATDPEGRPIAIPERSGVLTRPFPVYRRDGQLWSAPYGVRRDGGPFLVVGADVGPDGRLYVLERQYLEWRGFASRVRSFAFAPDGLRDEQLVLQTPIGRHDNLEAIATWRDENGAVRVTMISDDNFHPLQRTEFVEYRIAGPDQSDKNPLDPEGEGG